MSYEILPDDLLEQGDIIRHIELVVKSPSNSKPVETYRSPVVILSHGCDIDKPINPAARTDTVLVAAVALLGSQSKGNQQLVRMDKIWNVTYLPSGAPLPDECYIDWRTVQPVDKSVLLEARKGSDYLCSITGDLREKLAGQFWDFFFRPRPRRQKRAPR